MKQIKTFTEYNTFAKTTDIFEDAKINNLSDPAFVTKILGLTGESGETADKIKKIIRDKQGIATDNDITEIKKELGDVLWYIATISRYLGTSLDEVANLNVKKLSDRKDRRAISGAGDNR
jgi:NTP pyrophosphatase (non-canonical NTP hydrolase)